MEEQKVEALEEENQALDYWPTHPDLETPKPDRSDGDLRTPSESFSDGDDGDKNNCGGNWTNQEEIKGEKEEHSLSSSSSSCSHTSPNLAYLLNEKMQHVLEPLASFLKPRPKSSSSGGSKPLERAEVLQLSPILQRELDEVVRSATKQTEKLVTSSRILADTDLTYTVSKVSDFSEVYNINLHLQKGGMVQEWFHLSVTSEYPAQGPTFDIADGVGGKLADEDPSTFKTLLRDGISRLQFHRFTVQDVIIEWVRVCCKFYREICGVLTSQEEEQSNLRLQHQLRLVQQQQFETFQCQQKNLIIVYNSNQPEQTTAEG